MAKQQKKMQGMQMPSARHRRGPAMDVYTGLLLAAVIAMLAAVPVVYIAASRVAPSDQSGLLSVLNAHPETPGPRGLAIRD